MLSGSVAKLGKCYHFNCKPPCTNHTHLCVHICHRHQTSGYKLEGFILQSCSSTLKVFICHWVESDLKSVCFHQRLTTVKLGYSRTLIRLDKALLGFLIILIHTFFFQNIKCYHSSVLSTFLIANKLHYVCSATILSLNRQTKIIIINQW